MKQLFVLVLFCTPVFFTGCSKKKGDNGINLFSVQDDKDFGAQVHQEILSNPSEYPIIAYNTNPTAYNYLTSMRDDILNSGAVTYKNEFVWEVYIIKRDDVRNAFCTPGGYIYIYTGLIKYLDTKSSLAGVLGHEMAHADERHSTEQLTKIYGLQTLLDILLGDNQGLLTDIAAQLVTLQFSRSNEREADETSVEYLCPIEYRPDGAADFFAKLLEDGASSPPEFLSTHPSPDNRVEDIRSMAAASNCSTTISQNEENAGYQQFKNSL